MPGQHMEIDMCESLEGDHICSQKRRNRIAEVSVAVEQECSEAGVSPCSSSPVVPSIPSSGCKDEQRWFAGIPKTCRRREHTYTHTCTSRQPSPCTSLPLILMKK